MTGHLKLPTAEWSAPAFSLLGLDRKPLKKAGRTPGKEHSVTPTLCAITQSPTYSNVENYLLKGVEGDLHAASSFLLTDLRGPVDFLKDKLDGLIAAVTPINDITLLVSDDGGSGRARRLEL